MKNKQNQSRNADHGETNGSVTAGHMITLTFVFLWAFSLPVASVVVHQRECTIINQTGVQRGHV